MGADPFQGREYFEKAFRIFEEMEYAAAGVYLCWSGMANAIFFGMKDYQSFDRLVEQFDRIQALYPDYPSKEIEARVAAIPATTPWLWRIHTTSIF